MTINVLFFGILSEITKKGSVFIDGAKDTDELNNILQSKYPGLKEYSYRISVNQEMITINTPIRDGDEIALLPPFAGG